MIDELINATSMLPNLATACIPQAAERGHYDVAVLLVAANSSLASVRDRRDQLAFDLVKTEDHLYSRWSALLKNS